MTWEKIKDRYPHTEEWVSGDYVLSRSHKFKTRPKGWTLFGGVIKKIPLTTFDYDLTFEEVIKKIEKIFQGMEKIS